MELDPRPPIPHRPHQPDIVQVREVAIIAASPVEEATLEQSLHRSGVQEARAIGDLGFDELPEPLSCLLMVLDGSTRDGAVIESCAELQQRTSVRIICLYDCDLPLVLRMTHRLNVFIFLRSTAPAEVIASSVVLARYLTALSESTPRTKASDHADDRAVAITATLTARQRDVLRLLAKGYTNKAMAQHLVLSEPTVKMHLAALRRVFHASNRTEILTKALNLGLHSF